VETVSESSKTADRDRPLEVGVLRGLLGQGQELVGACLGRQINPGAGTRRAAAAAAAAEGDETKQIEAASARRAGRHRLVVQNLNQRTGVTGVLSLVKRRHELGKGRLN